MRMDEVTRSQSLPISPRIEEVLISELPLRVIVGFPSATPSSISALASEISLRSSSRISEDGSVPPFEESTTNIGPTGSARMSTPINFGSPIKALSDRLLSVSRLEKDSGHLPIHYKDGSHKH